MNWSKNISITNKVQTLRKNLSCKRNQAVFSWNHIDHDTKPSRFLHLLAWLGILLVQLSACQYIQKPEPYGMYRGMVENAPQGTETFRHGWKTGCNTGLSALGSLHYKATYKFEYDHTLIDNNEYHNAWRLGFRYCRWYISQWTRFE